MKNKSVAIFIVVVAITIIGLTGYAKLSKNEDNAISAKGIPAGAEELEKSHTAGITGALIAEETFYDFGTISMKNGNVSKTFEVSNETATDILVPSLTTSCLCTTAFILGEDGKRSRPFGMPGHGGAVPKANAIVKAGESMDIEVVYDPNAHGPAGVGKIDRFIYLEDDNGNKLQFEIKANVTP